MVGSELVQQSCPVENRIGPLQVAAVLLTRIDPGIRQLQICVADRTDTERVLTLPGGKVEVGELPEEAAMRELDEETGLKVRPSYKLGYLWLEKTYYMEQGKWLEFHIYTIPLFRCYPCLPERRIENHGPWMFLTIDEIISYYGQRCILPRILREVFTVPDHILEECLLLQLGYRGWVN